MKMKKFILLTTALLSLSGMSDAKAFSWPWEHHGGGGGGSPVPNPITNPITNPGRVVTQGTEAVTHAAQEGVERATHAVEQGAEAIGETIEKLAEGLFNDAACLGKLTTLATLHEKAFKQAIDDIKPLTKDISDAQKYINAHKMEKAIPPVCKTLKILNKDASTYHSVMHTVYNNCCEGNLARIANAVDKDKIKAQCKKIKGYDEDLLKYYLEPQPVIKEALQMIEGFCAGYHS